MMDQQPNPNQGMQPEMDENMPDWLKEGFLTDEEKARIEAIKAQTKQLLDEANAIGEAAAVRQRGVKPDITGTRKVGEQVVARGADAKRATQSLINALGGTPKPAGGSREEEKPS